MSFVHPVEGVSWISFIKERCTWTRTPEIKSKRLSEKLCIGQEENMAAPKTSFQKWCIPWRFCTCVINLSKFPSRNLQNRAKLVWQSRRIWVGPEIKVGKNSWCTSLLRNIDAWFSDYLTWIETILTGCLWLKKTQSTEDLRRQIFRQQKIKIEFRISCNVMLSGATEWTLEKGKILSWKQNSNRDRNTLLELKHSVLNNCFKVLNSSSLHYIN